MASMYTERLAMARPVIDKIVFSYKQDEHAQLIDLMLQGWAELEKHGLGAWSTVHASKTLIFPRNRGNGMLEISHVSEQVDEISQASFSLHEVLQACAVRMPPKGSDARKEIERLNEELVAAAHGHLAPVLRDDAEIMVTGCSHNSAGLKAIHAGAKCIVERISENGRYSASKIIGKCPTYEKPLKEGLRYFVMDYEVEQMWPAFVDLVVEACNVGSAIARPDTVFQLMQKVHRIAVEMHKEGRQIDYEFIGKRLARTLPALKHMIPEITKFVELWSGGIANPRFLDAIVAFERCCENPRLNNISKDMLKKINDVKIGTGQGGRYRVMLINALLSHDKLINVAIIGTLGKEGNVRTLAMKAEDEVTKFEAAYLKLPHLKGKPVPGEVTRQLGLCEADLICYVHNIKKTFKSINEIMIEHFDRVLRTLGINAKNPFRLEPAPKKARTTATDAEGIQNLGALGMHPDSLGKIAKDKGFDVGEVIVGRLDSKAKYTILSMPDAENDEDHVTLALRQDKRKKYTITLQALVDNYAKDTDVTMVTYAACNRSNRSSARMQPPCMHAFKCFD